MTKSSKKGFTLAEALITIAVIGTVAAFTIPLLTNNADKEKNIVTKKKAISDLSQATRMVVANNLPCKIYSHATLASCIAGALTGVTIDNSTNVENRVISADGITYEFYYRGSADSEDAALPLNEACGDSFTSYSTPAVAGEIDGKNSKCIVLVDTNGLGKGATDFNNPPVLGTACSDSCLNGVDQMVLEIQSAGVRPLAWDGGTYGTEAWEVFYGTNPYEAE